MTRIKERNWKPTRLVHSGTQRSGFGKTSEAMFLTQGYVYETAQAAEARFKGEEPGFIYSRYANPTVDMFEKRMCALEGAEDARATSSGMAAVTAAILCSLKAGDHIVAARALFGSCRWVVETRRPKTASRRRLSMAGISPTGNRRCGPRRNCSSWKVRPIRRSKSSTSGPSLASRIRSARGWWWTMSSPRPCSRSRWNSARISSSIRPLSISTDRAAASAASSCLTRNGSTRICTTISGTPGRACRPSTHGRC